MIKHRDNLVVYFEEKKMFYKYCGPTEARKLKKDKKYIINPKINVSAHCPVEHWKVKAGSITEMRGIEKKARSLGASLLYLLKALRVKLLGALKLS